MADLDFLDVIRPLVNGGRILCLGLGKPFTDRTAQIQLALLIELAASLKVPGALLGADDPVCGYRSV